jgi:predicted Abi (CAAX) family protease
MSKINASTSSPVTVARTAITTRPSLRDWAEAMLFFASLLILASYVGIGHDLFKPALTEAWLEFAIIAVIALFVPAFSEELIFRVVLPAFISTGFRLPPFMGEAVAKRSMGACSNSPPPPLRGSSPTNVGGRIVDIAAVALFVAWHPIQFWLGLPVGQALLVNPAFLAIVAALGLVCTISYRRSGSIWPASLMHWGMVVVWKGLTSPV